VPGGVAGKFRREQFFKFPMPNFQAMNKNVGWPGMFVALK
jgi:hypothetical protein